VTSHDPDGQHLNVLLAASKRDKIAQIRQVISRAGKQPVIIDVSAIAIQNAYNVNYRPTSNQTVALIDIGASAMTINIIQGSDSHFIRHISVGGNNYTEALQKELGLTFEQTEMLKRGERVDPNLSTMRVNSMLHSITVTLMNKIQETFELFQRTNISSPVIDRMLISGGSSRILHLVESLSDNFQMPVELFDSFRLINIDYERFDSTLIKSLSPIFAVAMGLATRVGRYAR
jgi:type IV pilus assembly protein PilM